jgi:allophanate hydrolase subunit 2
VGHEQLQLRVRAGQHEAPLRRRGRRGLRQEKPRTGVGFSNAFEESELTAAEWGLAVETDAEGLEYEVSGPCNKTETRTDGALSGIADVRWNGEE